MKSVFPTKLCLAFLLSAGICTSCSSKNGKDYESSDTVNGGSGASYQRSDSQNANVPQGAATAPDTVADGTSHAGSTGASQNGNNNPQTR